MILKTDFIKSVRPNIIKDILFLDRNQYDFLGYKDNSLVENLCNDRIIPKGMMGVALQAPSEVQALMNQATTPPDSFRVLIIDRLIYRLKTDGNWSLIDVLWIFAAHDQQFARLNWKSPSTFTITEVNSPAFVIDRGYTGNGTTSYLRTGWKPFSNGVNFTQNSSSIGVYNRTTATLSIRDFGCNDGSSFSEIGIKNVGNTMLGGINSNNTSVVFKNSVTQDVGLVSTVRSSSSLVNGSLNGVSYGNISSSSVAPPDQEIPFLGRNNVGTFSATSTRNFAMAYMGSGSIDQLKLYNAIQEYMKQIGANV